MSFPVPQDTGCRGVPSQANVLACPYNGSALQGKPLTAYFRNSNLIFFLGPEQYNKRNGEERDVGASAELVQRDL
jgi:hypothetical protein